MPQGKDSQDFHPDGARGFTLIELGLVVFLLALLAGILIPKMDAVFGFEGQRNLRILRALLEQTSQEALLRSSPLYVHMDLNTQEIWVDETPEATSRRNSIPPYPTLRLSGEVEILEIRKGKEGPLSKGILTLMFSKETLIDRLILIAQDTQGRIQTLWMNPANGMVSLVSGRIPEKIFEAYEDQPFYPGL